MQGCRARRLRAELAADHPTAARRQQILEEGLALVERQLELARTRRELAELESELVSNRRRIGDRLKELDT